MSPTGRRAPLPPSTYRRREIVDATGLVVRPVGQGGEDLGTYDFSMSPGALVLRKELAAAFARRARSHWDSAASCYTYAKSVQHFLRKISAYDNPPIASVCDLTPEAWKAWSELPGSTVRVRHLSLLLRELPGLPTAVLTASSKRRQFVAAKPKKSFTRSEMKRIRDAAAHTVRRTAARISSNLELLARWRSGAIAAGDPDWEWGALLDHLARTGDLPRGRAGDVRQWVRAACRERLGGWDVPRAVTQLFPSVVEKGAAAVLLICHEGWNLSVLRKMKVPDQWPNADGAEAEPAIHRLETDKARRQRLRHSSNNLVDLGEDSSGRAMGQVIAMTGQARRTQALLGNPSDLLLWSRGARYPMFSSGASGLCEAIDAWANQAVADLPAGVNSRQLRHTSQVLHGGPRNNTQAVQDDHYLRRDERVIEDSRDVVAAGLLDAVRHARETVKMRMVAPKQVGGQVGAHEIAEQSGLSLHVARQVARGELDTAVGACEDVERSPVTPGGGLCKVSFLLCFACPNSLATPRHLPRIVYLFQSLEALRSTVSPLVWTADWAGHHHRVEDLLGKHTDAGRWPALLGALTDRDKELIDRMLERRLDP